MCLSTQTDQPPYIHCISAIEVRTLLDVDHLWSRLAIAVHTLRA